VTATDTQEKRAHGFRAALSYRDFRWLVIGLSVSSIGSWAYNVALYVYVYDTTQSAAWAAATTLGRFIPSLIFGSYGGVIAERVERRRLLITLDLVMTVLMISLGVLTGVGITALVAIMLAGVASVLGTIYYPATAAMTPQVVDEPDLAAANALESLIENVSVIAGPALGAVILALFSVEVAFFFNAGTFLISAWCSSRIQARSQPSDVTEGGEAGILKQVVVGFKAITSSTTTAILVGASVLASFFYGTDTVLFVVYSEQRLGIGPDGFGLLLAGLGVGGIIAAPLVNRLAASPRLATIISAGLILYTLPTALLLMIEAPNLAFGVQILRGAGTLVVDVLAVTALQRSLPSDMIARVFGVFTTLVLAAISLGALVTAPLLAMVGLDTTLVIYSVGVSALVLVVYPRTRLVDREMRERLDALRPRITALESLGIFTSASRTALERLAAAAEEQSLPAGTRVIEEGAAADAFYVLTDGQVRVSAIGELGGDQQLRTMGPGEYFGEIGLLEQSPRTASVKAIDDIVVYRIPGEEFIASLAETTATAAFMEGARMRLARTHPSRDLTASALEGPVD
jgi:CRP-like cAMP-binding protein/predicted MFS family arabinose efflux permease